MKNGTRTAALSIQHVLAMYAGAVIVPLIVGECTWIELGTANLSSFYRYIDVRGCYNSSNNE